MKKQIMMIGFMMLAFSQYTYSKQEVLLEVYNQNTGVMIYDQNLSCHGGFNIHDKNNTLIFFEPHRADFDGYVTLSGHVFQAVYVDDQKDMCLVVDKILEEAPSFFGNTKAILSQRLVLETDDVTLKKSLIEEVHLKLMPNNDSEVRGGIDFKSVVTKKL